jgi:hypothetical protein
MTPRAFFTRAIIGFLGLFAQLGPVASASAQEHPVKRVASIVSVAVEEYGKGVDDQGRLISAMEYQEAVDFLHDARAAAERLPGPRAVAARAILDSIIAAVIAKKPRQELTELERRFSRALGSEAALELPKQAVDVAEGRMLYEKTCA